MSQSISLRNLSTSTLELSNRRTLSVEQGRVVAKTAKAFGNLFGSQMDTVGLSASIQKSLIRELHRITPNRVNFEMVASNLSVLRGYLAERSATNHERDEVELNFDAIDLVLSAKKPTVVGKLVSKAKGLMGSNDEAKALEKTLRAKRAQIRAKLALLSADDGDIFVRLQAADKALAGQLHTVTRNPVHVRQQAELRRDISAFLDTMITSGMLANQREKQDFLNLPVAQKLASLQRDLGMDHLTADQRADVQLLIELVQRIDPDLEKEQREARASLLAGMGDVLTPEQIRELGGEAVAAENGDTALHKLKRLVIVYVMDHGVPGFVGSTAKAVAGGVTSNLPYGLSYLPLILKTIYVIGAKDVVNYTPEAIKNPLRTYVPQRVQNLFFSIIL